MLARAIPAACSSNVFGQDVSRLLPPTVGDRFQRGGERTQPEGGCSARRMEPVSVLDAGDIPIGDCAHAAFVALRPPRLVRAEGAFDTPLRPREVSLPECRLIARRSRFGNDTGLHVDPKNRTGRLARRRRRLNRRPITDRGKDQGGNTCPRIMASAPARNGARTPAF